MARVSLSHLCLAAALCLSIPNGLAATRYHTVHTFKYGGGGGDTPEAGLVMDQAGNLYGLTTDRYSRTYSGAAFELIRNGEGWKFKVLYRFKRNTQDGSLPRGAMTFDSAGNLYGTTSSGGDANEGTAFELVRQKDGTWKEKVLVSFVEPYGESPQGGVVFDKQGNLYGTLNFGGAHGQGSVFELTPNPDGTWNIQVIYSFDQYGAQTPQ